MRVGDKVCIISTGYVGRITSVRYGAYASDGMQGANIHCDKNPRTKLPDYIEIDGHIQVHPDKVARNR